MVYVYIVKRGNKKNIYIYINMMMKPSIINALNHEGHIYLFY